MMPRHRTEHEPRHRAQRPAQERPRRVELRAVTARSACHRRPGNGVSIPWQAIGSAASARLIALGARFRPYRQNLLTGAVRGLVVSPWFAVGAGFVVAAGAFMYAPHAQLSFVNPLIARSPCKAVNCRHDSTTAEGVAGMPAGTGVGPVTPSPVPSPTTQTTGLTFGFTVTSHTRSGFHMTLAVTGKKAIGDWTFSFVIPGATDVSVLDATPVSPVTVTPTASATPGGSSRTTSPSPGTSASAAAAHGVDSADTLYLVVSGEGEAVAPADCTFDGVSCNFSAS
jgi:hypothetical protein